jgi:hypothetical protein
VFSTLHISTTQAPTSNLEFKPNYLVHAIGGYRKGKNQSIETLLLESKKQLPPKKHAKKSRIMHV